MKANARGISHHISASPETPSSRDSLYSVLRQTGKRADLILNRTPQWLRNQYFPSNRQYPEISDQMG